MEPAGEGAADVSSRGDLAVGAGDHERRAGRPVAALAHARDPERRGARARRAGCRGRHRQRAPRPLRREARPRPGLDRRLHDRGHRREQLLGDVLRDRAQRVPDAGIAALRAAVRHRDRYGRRRRGSVVRRGRACDGTRPHGAAIAHPARRAPRGSHPREVPDEEHDGLRVERLSRFQHAAFDPLAPARRLRRDARLHRGGGVPHDSGPPVEIHGTALVPQRAGGVRGDRASARLGGEGARADGPRVAALDPRPARGPRFRERSAVASRRDPGRVPSENRGRPRRVRGGFWPGGAAAPADLPARVHARRGVAGQALGRAQGANRDDRRDASARARR